MTNGWSGLRGLFGIGLFIVTVCVFVGFIPEDVSGQTDPPTTGDWTVSDDTLVKDAQIVMNGNLTVTRTGNLTLIDVVLMFNCSFTGQYHIQVDSFGRLTLKDEDHDPDTLQDATIVRALPSTYRYRWRCDKDSHLLISASVVRDCGRDNDGLFIATDDALIENSTITNGNLGIIVAYGSLRIEDSTIHGNHGYGIYVFFGSAMIKGCWLSGNIDTAIVVEHSNDVVVRGCTIEDNYQGGIYGEFSSISVYNCILSNISRYGLWFTDDSEGQVLRCIINDTGDFGMFVDGYSEILIEGCMIHDIPGRGLSIRGSTATVNGTQVLDCENDSLVVDDSLVEINGFESWSSGQTGIFLMNSDDFLVSDCLLIDNGGCGIIIGSTPKGWSSGLVRNCTIIGNTRAGIYVQENSSCIVQNGTFRDNGEYGFYIVQTGLLKWEVPGRATITNETVWADGRLIVDVDGHLTIVNTTFTIDSWGAMSTPFHTTGILEILDGDGQKRTSGDASEIVISKGQDPYPYTPSIRCARGHLISRNSFYEGIGIKVSSGSLNLTDCEFREGDHGVIFLESVNSGPYNVTGCLFSDVDRAVVSDGVIFNLTRSTISRAVVGVNVNRSMYSMAEDVVLIADTLILACDIGVIVDLRSIVHIEDTRILNCVDAIHVSRISEVWLNRTEIKRSSSHGVRFNSSRGYFFNTVVSDSVAGGVVANETTFYASNCTFSYNGRYGIRANHSLLSLGSTVIDSTDGIGLWVSFVHNPRLPIIPGDITIMVECQISRSTWLDLWIEGSFDARAVETSLHREAVRVYDDCTFTMVTKMEIRIWMMGELHVVPPPVDYQVLLVDGTLLYYGSMSGEPYIIEGSILEYIITETGLEYWGPYILNLTVAGRNHTHTFMTPEFRYLKFHYDIYPDLLPIIQVPEEVLEGMAMTLNATSSVGYPYDIDRYEWYLDEDPGVDLTGPSVTWTFPHDGVYTIHLTVIDSVGNENGTDLRVTVLDRGPIAILETALPIELDEDEEITMEGTYETVVDNILLQQWDFGDGSTAEGGMVTHSWEQEGTYNVTYTVFEVDGSPDSIVLQVRVVNVAPISLLPARSIEAGKMDLVLLDATGSYDTPSDRSSLKYLWTLNGAQMLIGAYSYYTFEQAGVYQVSLTVIDNDGASDTSNMTVEIINRAPTRGQMPDIRLNNTDPGVHIELRSFVVDPDDHETEWRLNVSVDEERIVAVDIHYDPEIGWYLRIHPFEGVEGSVEVTLKVDDGDGGTNHVTFIVTVVDHTPTEEMDTDLYFILLGVAVLAVVTVFTLRVYIQKR